MNTHQIKSHLLVVGGTGYIGYHLILAAKKKGWKVTSGSKSQPLNHRYIGGVKYLKVDIANLKALRKKLTESYTYVVNLGGYVSHISFKDKKKEVVKSHFLGLIFTV